MRNSGAIIGGVINFANNANMATAGGVAISTYLIFLAYVPTLSTFTSSEVPPLCAFEMTRR